MTRVAADLHIHSCFSMATSKDMIPDQILSGCRTKGINAIGSGDALHPEWRRMWEDTDNQEGIIILPTAEVEDQNRVHHLIFSEEFETFSTLEETFSSYCSHIRTSGRPHLRLAGSEIARHVNEAGGMIGPAHAFTPWRSIYAAFSSLADCYGDEEVGFLELGLSADSRYGAGISELAQIPFLTNSDAHSPHPAKLGRECTILSLESMTPAGLLRAIRSGSIEMNIGFFPEEGKYNRTACTRCYHQYSLEEAEKYGWRCPVDKGRIKKGVRDRALELTDGVPKNRPPYLHIIPLPEIISTVLGTSSPVTKKCRLLYNELIGLFDNELAILIAVSPDEIRSVHQGVGDAVAAFREGRVTLHPGGGGQYGSFSL
ncbi:histidinol phosphatase [Methanocalculus chunghsingensis]|uniref:Histidinol phosphatase n=1 Tax=Methanocalculus chunghsingensis TaxID=156457 RepID=A0A8J7WB74_9EURY|nr:PHP-associated domain-containing protein [Methanocalculus chunghsingensis]MBR1369737.1 histidinol phosphatase [Methanocalculus chunghsingensis]